MVLKCAPKPCKMLLIIEISSFFVEIVFGLDSPVPAQTRDPITVEIVTLGYIPAAGLSSLTFTAPAMNSAVKELRRMYEGKFIFEHTYLFDETIPDCRSMEDYSDHLLSSWYYKRATTPNLTAFISPSMCIRPASWGATKISKQCRNRCSK